MTKTAFITGVNGGIGQGLALGFRAAGYYVVGTDVQPFASADVDEYVEMDLQQLVENETYRAAISRKLAPLYPHLNVLINNAAVQLLDRFENWKLADWQTTLAVNVTAPMLLSQLFLPPLTENKGSIINIGSIHETLTKPAFVSYATSKNALVGATKALAVDLKGKVRVNAISPAAVETDMLRAGFNNDESAIDQLRDLHPVQRIGTPADVARLALFLASESNGFIHGANITLDGGISSVLHDL